MQQYYNGTIYVKHAFLDDNKAYKNGVLYRPELGYYYNVHASNCRKIYNEYNFTSVLTDGEELIFYRLSKYLSPQTNILVKKAENFEPMNFYDIMTAAQRGKTTIRNFLEKCLKHHIMAIFTKNYYDEKVYKLYGMNPFAVRAGSGWINVPIYQMWKDECEKFLPKNILENLEKDSGNQKETILTSKIKKENILKSEFANDYEIVPEWKQIFKN